MEINDPIVLRDHSPEVISHYVQWLYRGVVYNLNENQDTLSEEFDRLTELYVLGHAIKDSAFQNNIIDALIAATEKYNRYPTSLVGRVHAQLPKKSKLWLLLVDMWAFRGKESWITMERTRVASNQHSISDVVRAPAEFWQDVNMALWAVCDKEVED
ncbi:hypothetical protein NA57DRAFT_69871 [Rhizodiscina lignyota]|uniref:BTB domain-containing protein n=1 Tax=Rhizodiscina lignyota TaxID=1504668 RepID=A0A9P4IPK2_9PEZI|nr:hypothetical protein NA57DRAFT_69871 [Rhizodiscina lignyota]